MTKRTKKAGIVGKYGILHLNFGLILLVLVLEYPLWCSFRKQIKKMEVSQHSKFFCEFCGKYAVKRKAVGIWGCKDCGKMKAWGAYTLKFEDKLVVAAGKGDPASVMSEYGFKNVISIDEYASCFENIDPLAPYKKWTKLDAAKNPKFDQSGPQIDIFSERVQAAFIVSDPVDWSRDIQISLMIYRCLTLLGTRYGASLRKQIKKMEVSQHSKFFCEFCGKYAVKRKAVGIWGCKDCGKMKAWGAYTLKATGRSQEISSCRDIHIS
ncbi:60S ribosomal protein L37a [Trifolium repens]|nr:60S ribosomal protein L37a [Trifolium repens]